jgi:hypothetical protein
MTPDEPSIFELAHSLHVAGKDREALDVLLKKSSPDGADYNLFVLLYRSLKLIDQLDPMSFPQAHRIEAVEGLIQEGRVEAGLEALDSIPRDLWRARECAALLRSLAKLDRFAQAEASYPDIRRLAPIEQTPELHYYFAGFCERAGRFEAAKAVYRELKVLHPRFGRVAERLRILEALPAEETHLATTLMASREGLLKSPTDGEAARSLEEKERGQAIGGRLLLLRPIGVGGMGIVYRARDLKSGWDVAVKRLKAEHIGNESMRLELASEASILAGLKHRAIVAYFGSLEVAGVSYLIFEYIEGETLRDMVLTRGRLPAREAIDLLLPVCSALSYAHDRGVLHRDLKPGNVMLDQFGWVKVMDFGLARKAALPGAILETSARGTPAYMAPEQYDGHASDASDLYALGATAYEILCGHLPFEGEDLLSLKSKESYARLPPEIPPRLAEIVCWCLRPDPAKRPKSASEVADALQGVLA